MLVLDDKQLWQVLCRLKATAGVAFNQGRLTMPDAGPEPKTPAANSPFRWPSTR